LRRPTYWQGLSITAKPSAANRTATENAGYRHHLVDAAQHERGQAPDSRVAAEQLRWLATGGYEEAGSDSEAVAATGGSPVSRFAQHTRLRAAPGKRDALIAKFIESADAQRENPDCELMIVSSSPDSEDVVYLTEVWSSEVAWDQARTSPAVQAWAASMPGLVGGPPETTALTVLGGKGLS
jgi:quinol monooxygenase YgiN